MSAGLFVSQVSGLQYKKFLAFPWILTVTWPVDAVSKRLCPHCSPLYVCSLNSLPPPQDGAEYPLTQSGPYGRWFHAEFCDFVSVLVAQCQHSVLFDGYLMSVVISLLTELSDSYIRAFRHTCTLAGGVKPRREKKQKTSARASSVTAAFLPLSGQAAQRSGGRGPQPERRRREQPEAVRGAEGQGAATEEPEPAGEDAEEDRRGESRALTSEAAEIEPV